MSIPKYFMNQFVVLFPILTIEKPRFYKTRHFLQNLKLCVISDFRRAANEFCALFGFLAAYKW